MSALATVASYGLAGAPPVEPVETPGQWHALLQGACSQRVTGHLVHAIKAGAVTVDDAQWEEAVDQHRSALALELVLDRLLAATSTRLAGAGIEHRALKGAALAHTVYPRPELRSYGDVDVLVDSARYDDAITVLCAGGGQARFAEPRPGFTSRFGKGVCVVTADDLEIDVHRSFVAGPFGMALDLDDLFAAPTPVDLGSGVTVPALAPVPRFLHACFHAALGDRLPRLVPLRDIAQIVGTTDLDVAEVLGCAQRWRARGVVQHAVLSTVRTLQVLADHPLAAWAQRYEPERFERAALRAYLAPDRSYATQAAAGMLALQRNRDRAAYARALLLPDRRYARERGGYLVRLRRSARIARRWKQTA